MSAPRFEDASWFASIPLQKAGFRPLVDNRNATFNVAVDPVPRPAFVTHTRSRKPSSLVGLADWQTNLHFQDGTYGSGRSLFFRDHYLKGVGLTPLRRDKMGDAATYHSSGHMMPSAAIRELLVTEFLRAQGADDLVVPCIDVLLEPHDDTTREATRRTVAGGLGVTERIESGEAVAWWPVDGAFRALSVKEGVFARYTNLLWHLRQLGGGTSLPVVADFVRALAAFSDRSTPCDLDDVEASFVSFASSIDRGFANVLHANLLGVRWGSLNNNFTLDGRYLDLETPTVLDGFRIAMPSFDESDLLPSTVFAPALEAYGYLRQMRRFVFEVSASLLEFAELAACDGERHAAALHRRVDKLFRAAVRTTFVERHAPAEALVLGAVESLGTIAPKHRARVVAATRALISAHRHHAGESVRPSSAKWQLERLADAPLLPEYVPPRLAYVGPSHLRSAWQPTGNAALFRECVSSVCGASSFDDARERLRAAVRTLHRKTARIDAHVPLAEHSLVCRAPKGSRLPLALRKS